MTLPGSSITGCRTNPKSEVEFPMFSVIAGVRRISGWVGLLNGGRWLCLYTNHLKILLLTLYAVANVPQR